MLTLVHRNTFLLDLSDHRGSDTVSLHTTSLFLYEGYTVNQSILKHGPVGRCIGCSIVILSWSIFFHLAPHLSCVSLSLPLIISVVTLVFFNFETLTRPRSVGWANTLSAGITVCFLSLSFPRTLHHWRLGGHCLLYERHRLARQLHPGTCDHSPRLRMCQTCRISHTHGIHTDRTDCWYRSTRHTHHHPKRSIAQLTLRPRA